MQIKRSLNESAKRLSPEIEASNTGTQIAEHANRIAELIDYAEDKEARRKESEKTGLSFDEREKERRRKIALPDHEIAAAVQAEDETQIAEDQAQEEAQPDVVQASAR